MEIYKCGTRVTPKLQNIEGIITAISIRFLNISYEISYFYNGDYKVIWLNEDEFTATIPEKASIGFK